MSAFKAYDFRGVFGEDFTLEEVYAIGFFLPQLLKVDKILVGRDMRTTSCSMFEALSSGIMDAGANVYNMGETTTPMVYYFTAKHHFDSSVMITASHNPKNHNGLKFSRRDALPMGYDSGLKELELMVKTKTVKPVAHRGHIIDYPVKEEYLQFMQQYRFPIDELKIVMDCSNGMASILVHDLFGNQPHYLFDELDGTFPNHEANPIEQANLQSAKEKVKALKADIGVIFDGDADRVVFLDEQGNFISPDLIIAVLSLFFIDEKNMEGSVIQDIRTSKSVTEYITKKQREVCIWRVGRAYAALKLREIKGAFGGEFAGHYYYRDFFYSDSGILTALIVLHLVNDLKKQNVSFSQLINQISCYANSGELNYTINNKQEAMDELKNHFLSQEHPTTLMDFDGYRIEFKDWWFNIRPSNTEPYLRLIMEAKTNELLQLKLKEIISILTPYFSNN